MPSVRRVAARYREAMFGFDTPRKEKGLGAADVAAIRRLVRVPDPLYVAIDPLNLTWVYRQGVRQPKVYLYETLRQAFKGGYSPNKAVAVVNRSDLDPSKLMPQKAGRIEFKGRIPRENLYMFVTRNTMGLPPGSDKWMIPVVRREGGRWRSTRPVVPWKDLPTEDPVRGPAEAVDGPYGEYLFGELRPDVSEPNTPEESALISALISHYQGSGDSFSKPALSGAVAVTLRAAHQKGLYPEWLQVPSKYKYAYRLMDNISSYGMEKLLKGDEIGEETYPTANVVENTGGTYRPHKGKVTSWTVSKEAIRKMVQDWRFRVSREYPDGDENIAIAVVDLGQVRDSFMLNPDRIAELGLAGDFTYQSEVLGWGSFPMARFLYAEVDNSDWESGRDQAEENEERLDEDEDLDWADLDGYSSVEEFDSDMAQYYAKAREDLISELVAAL